MKELPSQKQQHSEINSLVCLYEQWLPLLNELDELKQNTSCFEADLQTIRQQQQQDLVPSNYPVRAKVKEIKRATVNLIKLRDRVDDIIILKEKIEAIEDNSKNNCSFDNYSKEFANLKQQNQIGRNSRFADAIARTKTFKLQQPQNRWGIIIATIVCLLVVGRGLEVLTPDSESGSKVEVTQTDRGN